MYSLVEGNLPANSNLQGYDGIEMAFANMKVNHFKVRLSDSRDDTRYIAAVKTNNEGEHNVSAASLKGLVIYIYHILYTYHIYNMCIYTGEIHVHH